MCALPKKMKLSYVHYHLHLKNLFFPILDELTPNSKTHSRLLSLALINMLYHPGPTENVCAEAKLRNREIRQPPPLNINGEVKHFREAEISN